MVNTQMLLDENYSRALAEAAIAANGQMTTDDLFRFILDGVRRDNESRQKAYDCLVRVFSTDYEKIYANYAADIGRDKLSKAEKKQALLNHILAQSAK